MELQEAFINFFIENSMELEEDDWISAVQIALNKKEMDQTAFNILYQKADKLNKDLSDIHKLQVRFRNYYRRCFEGEDEGEDEDEKQKQKQQQDQKRILLTEEAERLIKVMGDIAVDLGIQSHIEIIHDVLYDVEKGEQKKRDDGSLYFVDTKKNLSRAQMKMTQFAEFLAHPPPPND
jgi:hypothetical protein